MPQAKKIKSGKVVTKKTTKKTKSKINKKDLLNKILDDIRPALERDGGNLELVKFDEKKCLVEISFQGACAHCPLADVTLHHLIEAEVKAQMPEVKTVRAV